LNSRRTYHRSLTLWMGVFLAGFLLPAAMAWEAAASQTAAVKAGAPKTVLLLHSYHPELPWTRAINQAMLAVLNGASWPVTIHSEYMDAKRNFDPTYLELLRALYAHKYAHTHFDAILTSDNHAFNFILARGDTLFPGVPVVFCGVNNFDPGQIPAGKSITGVVEAIDMTGTITVARKLHPKARRIIAVSDQTITGQANRLLFAKALSGLSDPLPADIWDHISMTELQKRLAGLDGNELVFWLHFTLDAAGKYFSFEESASQISAASKAPLYSFWDFLLGHGIVGGKLISGDAQGNVAARMAIEILSGKRPADIPIRFTSPNRYMFDDAQLKRFHLDIADLPAGSVISNKPQDLTSRALKILLAAGLLCMSLMVVILSLLANIRRRRRAEASLAESRDRYQRIFDTATVSLWEEDFTAAKEVIDQLKAQGVTDFEAYFKQHPQVVADVGRNIKVLDVNPRTLALYGAKNKTELLGSLEKITTADTIPLLAKQLVAIATGQRHLSEEGINRKLTGELIYIHLSITLDESERPFNSVLVSIIDITDRKRSEQALQASESRFRGAFENAATGMALISLRGFFMRVNPLLCDMLNATAAKLQGTHWESYLTAEDLAYHRERIDRLYAGKSNSLQLELRLHPLRGEPLWVLLTASLVHGSDQAPDHIICQVLNIHQRKATERALRISEERYRQFYQDDPSGVYIAQPDGHILTCNPAFLRIFGFRSTEHALVTNLVDLYPSPEGRQVFIEKLLAEKRLENYAADLRRLDGQSVHVRLNAIAIFDDGGEFSGIRGYLVDMTRQQNLEKQLLHAQKMEAVGTMAGGVAHDFNNLLMGILGNASLMRMDLPPEHPYHERLELIETHVRSGSELTRQLLGFAKGGKYEAIPTDLNRLIQDNAGMFGRTRKEVRIETHLASDLGTVVVDRSQMDQVFYNLYVNAWQSMEEGGRLTITTRNVRLSAEETGGREIPPGNYAEVSVADNGEGIPPENLPRIFDPFYTTKTLSRGTGLGLASVYGIINNHQGMIEVESQVGRGTCFRIHLPIKSAKTGAPPLPLSDSSLLKGHETLLLVDDEPLVIQATDAMLSRLGYTLLTAESGQLALDLFEKEHTRIDLVILDMIMPGMSGSETFDRLQAVDPEVKVLLSSGFSRSGQAEAILVRGGKGFIPKPFDMGAISRKIRAILDEEPDNGS
jgi:two-component system, cell cycle sensor histidine kinase and response regulator CckA